MKKIWIVVWNTESADEGRDGFFTKKPTVKQLKEYMARQMQDDFEAGTLYYHLEEFSPIKL